MTVETVKQNDEVLGYKLIRKIGSGGYGDVWEAEAPGGLRKALKIVFGYHDEKRAQAELKSLDRVKEARHPFLLSLERFEIFNSQLVIVCELAEKSLSDLADQYLERGEQGIPRDELIGYMRDAADALDYLNNSFGLQHLDIKPENLLLVSGHAKVADFGLVKDLRDNAQSMLSGMTPAYAAPELFDGRPGSFSDQYSLATVYQEMLTMIRPFSGSTPAQLAAQHMHGKPDLRPLPISDQSVVAKALAKVPEDRYKSCAQFVEQLSNRKTRKRIIKSRANVRESVDTASATVVFETANSENQTALFSKNGLTFNKVDLEFVDPPNCDPEATVYQPTLVIGVGNSASQVVQRTKCRMSARHGEMDKIPAFRMLCVDSDRDALSQMSIGGNGDQIKVNETLSIPLRRSEQYRQKKNLDLSWISRRWIYNVPRSQQTEGLRPLGRLAFVDHFETICTKISDLFKDVLKPENIATTCETFGLNPPTEIQPRVVLVSNIAGGLGSGITNELAYTIRLMAAEQGIKHCEIIGMLMYGNEVVGREAGLAQANAYAFLGELRHFADGGYPGDMSLGIPEFEDDLPFDHIYSLRLRSEKETSNLSDTDKIAEYVCLSMTTPCGEFFTQSRTSEKEREEFSFRSFGLGICGPGLHVQGQGAVEQLSRDLIGKWIGPGSSSDAEATNFADQQFEELGLSLDRATASSVAYISKLDEWQVVKTKFEAAWEQLTSDGGEFNLQDIEFYFDELFDRPHFRSETVGGLNSELMLAVENEISSEGQMIGNKLSMNILDQINSSDIAMSRSAKALEATRDRVFGELQKVAHGLKQYGSTMHELQQDFSTNAATLSSEEWPIFKQRFVENYGKIRFQEFALRCCNHQYRVLKSCLVSTQEMIKKYRMQLDTVGDKFDIQEQSKKSAKYTPTIQQMLVSSILDEKAKLILQVEKLVADEISSDGEEFLAFLGDTVRSQQFLPGMVREAAQKVLSNAFDKISIDDVIKKNDIQTAAVKSWLNELMNEATPFVTDCGGAASMMLGQPRKAPKSVIPSVINESFNVNLQEISGTTGDLVLCFEAEQISLANVAYSILRDAPEAIEIAKRIHSRNDIDWTTLDDLM